MIHPVWLARLTYAGIVVGALVVLYLARTVRRWRAVPRGAWLVLELKGTVSEVPPPTPPWRRWLDRRRPHSVLAVQRCAERIGRDARVEGVLLRLGDLECGWATAASLRDWIASMRASGKRVVAYLPHGGMTRELFIATAAEKIYTTPQATIAPLGLASGMTFYKTLLASGGVEAECIARREFKSAADSFTRDDLSEPNKMQIGALLDVLHGALVKAIETGRGRTEAEARAMVDTAMFRAGEAVEQKLIDGVAYDDEIATRIGVDTKRMMEAPRYVSVSRPWALWNRPRRGRGQRVGIVEVRGAIVTETSMAMGRVADSRSVIGALRAARKNPGIGAVVLFVDSPGGSALASDLIAREVERLKEKKPVVAYFSNVAASGGYYVAALASEIVAQSVSITGSIGVIALRFVFERTLEKLGLHHEVIRRGARADMLSPYRKWTADEHALFDHEIDGSYRDFVGIVARGRGRPADEIEPLARGRVYAARDALDLGLVDRLGGLRTALDRAAELGKIMGSGDPVLVHAPRVFPEPAEPPAPVQPIAQRLGLSVDLINLALSGGRERLFALEDRIQDLG